VANEDRKQFFDVERPFAVKASDFALKVSEEALEYEQEELRQLEKMYKADDITRRRADRAQAGRDNVEKAKFGSNTPKSIATRR